MQTGTIEAHGLGEFDVAAQCLVGGCRPDAVGIEALIEHQTLVVGLVVQVEIAVCHVHLAHSGIRLDAVDDLAAATHLIDHLIEERRLRRPQFGILHGHHCHGTVSTRDGGLSHLFLTVEHLHSQLVAGRLTEEARMDDELLLVDVGHGEHRLQALLIDGFEPYRLPDARGTGVHTTVGIEFEGLLTTGLHTAAQVVLHPHHEVVTGAGLRLFGDVERER